MSNDARTAHKLERLVFFSDAVFAIAITLLIIDVRLPAGTYLGEAGLAQALVRLTPNYVAFVLSFLVIGQFWRGHHNAFGWLAASDDRLVGRNLALLLLIAAFPFPTMLIGLAPLSRLVVIVYAGWLALVGVANLWMLAHALAGPLLAADAPPGLRRGLLGDAMSPVLIGAGATACAFIDPRLALVPLTASPLILWWFHRRARRLGFR